MKTSLRSCAWCGAFGVELDDDHIFPRSIGGTKQLKLKACRKCQTSIGDAEKEMSRRSVFALHCVDSGPPGRSKRKPTSGMIETIYTLNHHPLGGYGEAVLKSGGGIHGLPYIEVDVSETGPRGNLRAASPMEAERLLATFEALFKQRPDAKGLICELLVKTELDEVATDPEFWPRVVLGLDGNLFIRARNPDEAAKLVDWVVRYINSTPVRDHSGWKSGEVKGGSSHTVAISFDWRKVDRVIAKIACGLVLYGTGDWEPSFLTAAKGYVRGESRGEQQFVRQVKDPGALSFWPEHHVAAVLDVDHELKSVVSLFGSCHVVSLGTLIGHCDRTPIVARSRRDGTETVILTGCSASEIVEKLLEASREIQTEPEGVVGFAQPVPNQR